MFRFLGKLWITITGIIFIAIAVNFAVSNTDSVVLKFLPFDGIPLPLWLVILGAFGVGLLTGGITMLPALIASNINARKLKRQTRNLEEQLAKADTDKQALMEQSEQNEKNEKNQTENTPHGSD